jgi:hypothetical protein
MIIFNNFDTFTRLSDINQNNLSKEVAYEDILRSARMNFNCSDSIAWKFFRFFGETIICFLSLSIIHPQLSHRITNNNEVITKS